MTGFQSRGTFLNFSYSVIPLRRGELKKGFPRRLKAGFTSSFQENLFNFALKNHSNASRGVRLLSLELSCNNNIINGPTARNLSLRDAQHALPCKIQCRTTSNFKTYTSQTHCSCSKHPREGWNIIFSLLCFRAPLHSCCSFFVHTTSTGKVRFAWTPLLH